jgi:hypothetical protein
MAMAQSGLDLAAYGEKASWQSGALIYTDVMLTKIKNTLLQQSHSWYSYTAGTYYGPSSVSDCAHHLSTAYHPTCIEAIEYTICSDSLTSHYDSPGYH